MMKRLNPALFGIAALLVLTLPTMADDVPVEEEQAQTEPDDSEVICRDIVVGRDPIPGHCMAEAGSTRQASRAQNSDGSSGEVICRSRQVTGSHIRRRVCMTEEERAEETERGREILIDHMELFR